MSSILYYSNYCEKCKDLLNFLSKSSIKDNIHYVCVDKRIQKNNANYVILENNQELLLPNTINAVPALLLLNDNYKVLFGNNIIDYLKPIQVLNVKTETNYNEEPSAFMLNGNLNNVHSDCFSFLDQDTDDLSAKGNGGMRQLYNYATINNVEKIVTPEENYIPDKVNEDSLKNYEENRNKIQ